MFNPVTQADRFDRDRAYVGRFIAEGRANPHPHAVSYFDAIPRHWRTSIHDPYPEPVIGHREGRARALAEYENRGFCPRPKGESPAKMFGRIPQIRERSPKVSCTPADS